MYCTPTHFILHCSSDVTHKENEMYRLQEGKAMSSHKPHLSRAKRAQVGNLSLSMDSVVLITSTVPFDFRRLSDS